ncbi:MAG: hypothetical protein GY820_01030, partial [Gammaproteobacteria bacterium]|nr:hypothetical protein [Gammaproteobacteria bacterium]
MKGIIRRNSEEKQLEEEVPLENVPKIVVTSICMMRSIHHTNMRFIMAGETSPQVESGEIQMSQQPQLPGGLEPPACQEPALPVLSDNETAQVLRNAQLLKLDQQRQAPQLQQQQPQQQLFPPQQLQQQPQYQPLQQQAYHQPQYYAVAQPSSSQAEATPMYPTVPQQAHSLPQGSQLMQPQAFVPTPFQQSAAYYPVTYYAVPQPQSMKGVAQPQQQQYVHDPQSQLQAPSAFQPQTPMMSTGQPYVPIEEERLAYRDRAASMSSREPSQIAQGYAPSETASQPGYPQQVTPLPYESPDVARLSAGVAVLYPQSSIPRGEDDRKRDHSRSKERSPSKHMARRKDSRSKSSSDEEDAETRRQIKEAEKLILNACQKLEKRDRDRDRRRSLSRRRVPQEKRVDSQTGAQKALLFPTSATAVPSTSPEKQVQHVPQPGPSDSQEPDELSPQEIKYNLLIARGFTQEQAYQELSKEVFEHDMRFPQFDREIPRGGLVFGKHVPQSVAQMKKGPDQTSIGGTWHHPAKGRGQPFQESAEIYSPGAPMSTLSGSDQSRPQEFPGYIFVPKGPVQQGPVPHSTSGHVPMEVAPMDRVRTTSAGQWSHQSGEREYT